MEATASCKVVQLDSRRPRAYVQLYCMFCFTEHAAVVTVGLKYYECTGCDEVAAVPVRRVTG